MSKTRFTPGPWDYQSRDFRGHASEFDFYIVGDVSPDDEGGSCVGIAKVFGNSTAGVIPLANARLMAAAPELLAALEGCLPIVAAWYEEQEKKHGPLAEGHPWLEAAKAAVAKAEGE